ncbi:MAG: type II toxin-antitoxin system HipA family toxin YjjJ [Pseudomonadota bacterium]
MRPDLDTLRLRLAGGPQPARALTDALGLSQPTLSRRLAGLGSAVVRIGAARSIQYALRDTLRGLPDIAVYRVDASGQLSRLGLLVPVRPDGFVMHTSAGDTLYSPGLPWWLLDMRPQGYLGRAYVARHGAALGLPARLGDWSDTDALRALLVHGHDPVGNLVLGDGARDQFIATPVAEPVAPGDKPATYMRLAREAAQGEAPGSSAGGEQPKFTAWSVTADGPRHVLVKFSEAEPGPVPQRWRDLLLAEHIALQTLAEGGVPAARTALLDAGGQRFLEVVRFDRTGPLGRRGIVSLAAMDAEFVGAGPVPWPVVVQRLADAGHVQAEAVQGAALLWAFGALIGNTDMHAGNLSFVTEQGRPWGLAPAYDMSSMAFAPRSGGSLPDALGAASLHPAIPHDIWRQAAALAGGFLVRARDERGFSRRFASCLAALAQHQQAAREGIARLG